MAKEPFTPEKKIKALADDIRKEIAIWESHRLYGCQDPFFSDGENMYLIRNQIIYYKTQLQELCTKNNLPLPDEYYLPTPPEVPKNYFAPNSKYFQERSKRYMADGRLISTAVPPPYKFDTQELF